MNKSVTGMRVVKEFNEKYFLESCMKRPWFRFRPDTNVVLWLQLHNQNFHIIRDLSDK